MITGRGADERSDGSTLLLRPEGTAPVARLYAAHYAVNDPLQRLYYLAPMFRHERPQRGRLRQFHQVHKCNHRHQHLTPRSLAVWV